MGIADKLHQHINRLPESLQAEVLDFIEFLVAKSEREERKIFSDYSLRSAARELDVDAEPAYSQSDIKERY